MLLVAAAQWPSLRPINPTRLRRSETPRGGTTARWVKPLSRPTSWWVARRWIRRRPHLQQKDMPCDCSRRSPWNTGLARQLPKDTALGCERLSARARDRAAIVPRPAARPEGNSRPDAPAIPDHRAELWRVGSTTNCGSRAAAPSSVLAHPHMSAPEARASRTCSSGLAARSTICSIHIAAASVIAVTASRRDPLGARPARSASNPKRASLSRWKTAR